MSANRLFFILSRLSSTDTDDLQDSRGKEGISYCSTPLLPTAYEHSDMYLQICMWDGYHIFIYQTATSMGFTTLSNYHMIDWWRDVNFCLLTWWIDSWFSSQKFDTGNRWTSTRIDYHPCITTEPTKHLYNSQWKKKNWESLYFVPEHIVS